MRLELDCSPPPTNKNTSVPIIIITIIIPREPVTFLPFFYSLLLFPSEFTIKTKSKPRFFFRFFFFSPPKESALRDVSPSSEYCYICFFSLSFGYLSKTWCVQNSIFLRISFSQVSVTSLIPTRGMDDFVIITAFQPSPRDTLQCEVFLLCREYSCFSRRKHTLGTAE